MAWRSLWVVCSVGTGMMGEEWSGSRRSCMEVSRECWWRRRG